jgi:hypothetical protein
LSGKYPKQAFSTRQENKIFEWFGAVALVAKLPQVQFADCCSILIIFLVLRNVAVILVCKNQTIKMTGSVNVKLYPSLTWAA